VSLNEITRHWADSFFKTFGRTAWWR
jgi:hypothetical protein